MDFGHSSEAFMPDLTPHLNSTLLARVAEFLGESGSLKQYEALLVWRSLSRHNKPSADGAVQAQNTANFSGCWNLTDAAAQHLAARCPWLEKVNFAHCYNLTDAAAQHLARWLQLRTVNFERCRNLTDAAAQHLARCPQLQTVNFQGCPMLTDAAAQHLAQCPLLQTANFQGCENVTYAAAQYLTPRHPLISVLGSQLCYQIMQY